MKAFHNFNIPKDEHNGPHGWYWSESAIAGIVAKAYKDNISPDALEYITIYVSDLAKIPLGANAVGCHDTLYSVTVLVSSTWNDQHPTAEQVFNAFKETNAQFKVEAITGGYHFYKIW